MHILCFTSQRPKNVQIPNFIIKNEVVYENKPTIFVVNYKFII